MNTRTKGTVVRTVPFLMQKYPKMLEIANIAMTNETTFCRHFEDIYQLSDEVKNEVIDKCLKMPGAQISGMFFRALLTIVRFIISVSPAAERVKRSIVIMLSVSQRHFPVADGGIDVHIAVAYFSVECGDDLVLPLQKVRACQVRAGDGVVRDEGAVAGQVLHKEF